MPAAQQNRETFRGLDSGGQFEVKAVLFDMDGVLIDSAAVANRLLAKTAAEHGVTLSEDELESLAGYSGAQFWSYVKKTHGLPGAPEEYRESYDAAAEVAEYHPGLVAPGVVDLWRDLVGAGTRVGVVTSASRWRTGEVLKLLGVQDQAAVVVSSDDVASHKPDPAPYLLACSTLDLSPGHCIALEDSARGIAAANAAGLVSIAYTGLAEDLKAEASARTTLNDFRGIDSTHLRSLYEEAVV